MIRWQRFPLEDIQPGAGQLARLQQIDQGSFIDGPAAPDVDQQSASRQRLEHLAVD